MKESNDDKGRRAFLKDVVLGGVGATLYGLGGNELLAAGPEGTLLPLIPSGPVPLVWLGQNRPLTPVGVSFGVPWARGVLPQGKPISVQTPNGQSIPTQSWPMAFWPDGSVKWTGLSIAGDDSLRDSLTAVAGSPATPAFPLTVQEASQVIDISTGPMRCRIARRGKNIIESLIIDDREVGRNGHLVVVREDRSEYESKRQLREEEFISHITSVKVEQSGPVRAVVHIEGTHARSDTNRNWIPFSVRLYFTSGLNSIRIVHSFIFDGDATNDYIRGIGLTFSVPFREELQNRHIRFGGEGTGVWSEPVLMSPAYKDGTVRNALKMRTDQLAGVRIPNLDELSAVTKAQFETIAVWDAFKLTQLSCDSFSIDKSTGKASSWVRADGGTHARGFAFVGDVSGGLAVGMKHFWEKNPSSLEITGATQKEGALTIWLWSPDAAAMDLRHYDTIGHDMAISYEDYEPGFSTPEGIANTNEFILWALPETPTGAVASALSITASEPPLMVCTPEYYHSVRAFGMWSLPDRSTPDKAAMEEQMDRFWRFLSHQVEQRRWYGLWNYGDIMRTYDPGRHQWLYDIGGHAWNNTEHIPDMWLWLTFLRTGRADVFRFAEAATRHSGEVDVYHAGRFAGLGSRHNVVHWGCGAKEARISSAYLKRPYYYLTTDERTGDLMREVLQVDEKLAEIPPLRKALPRPDVPVVMRSGPDWIALACNWMTEWERTGDKRYRDYVYAGMKSLGDMPEAFRNRTAFRYDLKTKQLFDIGEPNLKNGEFLILFGGDQIGYEIMQLIECPEFAKAWNDLMYDWARDNATGEYSKARIMGYAAYVMHDAELGAKVWTRLRDFLKVNGQDRFPAHPALIEGSAVPHPVEEIANYISGSSHWALNIMIASEFARDYYKPA